MKIRDLTPTKLRLILSGAFLTIVILSVVIFYIAYRNLAKTAADVGAKVASASQSQNTLQELQKLERELDTNREIVNRTARVVADGQNYTYQNQIIDDLTAYADRSGMTLNNISFLGAPGSATAPAPGAGADSATPAGLKRATIAVTLKNPADYRGLLNFLHYIEQNLTKLKIAKVTLTKSDGGKVNTDVLNLEIYVR